MLRRTTDDVRGDRGQRPRGEWQFVDVWALAKEECLITQNRH